MGIEFDYDFETNEILVHDAPKGSAVIVDGVKYVPDIQGCCEGCVHYDDNSKWHCVCCIRYNWKDQYEELSGEKVVD